MPRVSEAHLAARRGQILEAATYCFARNGFHATSMQDVIRQAGLSVGAVYRYFKSKEQLRRAIADRNLEEMGGALDKLIAMDPPLPLPEVMSMAIDVIESRMVQYGPASIALQVWAESVRDPELHEFVQIAFGRLRGGFIALVRRAQEAGHAPREVDAGALGMALFSVLAGYVMQRLLTGQPDRATLQAGVHALLTSHFPARSLAGPDCPRPLRRQGD